MARLDPRAIAELRELMGEDFDSLIDAFQADSQVQIDAIAEAVMRRRTPIAFADRRTASKARASISAPTTWLSCAAGSKTSAEQAIALRRGAWSRRCTRIRRAAAALER